MSFEGVGCGGGSRGEGSLGGGDGESNMMMDGDDLCPDPFEEASDCSALAMTLVAAFSAAAGADFFEDGSSSSLSETVKSTSMTLLVLVDPSPSSPLVAPFSLLPMPVSIESSESRSFISWTDSDLGTSEEVFLLDEGL